MEYGPGVDRVRQLLLCDAQTSGGLLIAVAPDRVEQLLVALTDGGGHGTCVGEVHAGPVGHVRVV